jgi:hypothetical protein
MKVGDHVQYRPSTDEDVDMLQLNIKTTSSWIQPDLVLKLYDLSNLLCYMVVIVHWPLADLIL